MARLRILASLVIAGLVAYACGEPTSAGPSPTSASGAATTSSAPIASSAATTSREPIKIASVVEMTGAGAVTGADWDAGVRMAAQDMNALKGSSRGILGHEIEVFTLDTETQPIKSVAAMRAALQQKPLVVMGTVYSSSTIVNMQVLQQAGVPQFTGSTAPDITAKGNDNIFRTQYSAQLNVNKVVKFLTDAMQTKRMALVYANDDYGQGGRKALTPLLQSSGISLVADVSTQVGQTDFTGELARVVSSGADTLFLYVHQDEAARLLKQAASMDLKSRIRIAGDATALDPATIKLAGAAADGVRGLNSWTGDAPVLKDLGKRYEAAHRGQAPSPAFFQAYTHLWLAKYAFEDIGKLDQAAFRQYLHNRTFCASKYPKLFSSEHIDGNGDIDRDSYVIEIQNQQGTVTGTVGPVNPSNFSKC